MGVGDGFGDLAEEFFHLVARLQIEFLAGETHAFLFLDLRAGLDAEHRVVRAGVVFADVVNVVRRDDLQVKLLGEFQEAGDNFELLGDAVVLDFDEVVFLAEDLHEACAGLAGLVVIAGEQSLRHERGEAPLGRDLDLTHIEAGFDVVKV